MFIFKVNANTCFGEEIFITGSHPNLGEWDPKKAIKLTTDNISYPLWYTELIDLTSKDNTVIEYKYFKRLTNGDIIWEEGIGNRWIPYRIDEQAENIIVYDGNFNEIQPWPLGFYEKRRDWFYKTRDISGLRVVVLGSSVAFGADAWLLRGWAYQLGTELNKRYGHELINVSKFGANTEIALTIFNEVVRPLAPDIVIISLSFANEGFVNAMPADYRKIVLKFENGLKKIIKAVYEINALPVIAGLYPNNHYNTQQNEILVESNKRIISFTDISINWLDKLNDGSGKWIRGSYFDAGHPNTYGHKLMFESINLNAFDLKRSQIKGHLKTSIDSKETIFIDSHGFTVIYNKISEEITFKNPTPYDYTVHSGWFELSTLLKVNLKTSGFYLSLSDDYPGFQWFFVNNSKELEGRLIIKSHSTKTFFPLLRSYLFIPESETLYHDDKITIIRAGKDILVANYTEHTYNVHPMWEEVRVCFKSVRHGLYEDVNDLWTAFRSLIVGDYGLESRVKIPPKVLLRFSFISSLSDIRRVVIIPIGHRCAIRMLLYRIEYDGPCFPFCLARTMNLSDVTDIIRSGFSDMWNPNYLYYSAHDRRIYHRKWSSLSFGHEVEDTDDPIGNFGAILSRIRRRYSDRARRFWHAVTHADEVLFIRTGTANKDNALDFVKTMQGILRGKPFKLMLFVHADPGEFTGIDHVIHYNFDFDPDRMHRDHEYWQNSANTFREILNKHGITTRNLYWCPNKIENIPKDDKNVSDEEDFKEMLFSCKC